MQSALHSNDRSTTIELWQVRLQYVVNIICVVTHFIHSAADQQNISQIKQIDAQLLLLLTDEQKNRIQRIIIWLYTVCDRRHTCVCVYVADRFGSGSAQRLKNTFELCVPFVDDDVGN